jgi:Rap1a immunity proteins
MIGRFGAMKMLVAAALTVVVFLVMNGSAAAATPAELLQSCQSALRAAGATNSATVEIPVEGLACWYYMSAVQNMSVVIDQQGRPLLGICAPAGTTLMEFVRIFTRYAQAHREEDKDTDNAAPLVLRSLLDAFPCGARQPT